MKDGLTMAATATAEPRDTRGADIPALAQVIFELLLERLNSEAPVWEPNSVSSGQEVPCEGTTAVVRVKEEAPATTEYVELIELGTQARESASAYRDAFTID